nr:hypothetical protein [Tanacetum cinerariifolium]
VSINCLEAVCELPLKQIALNLIHSAPFIMKHSLCSYTTTCKNTKHSSHEDEVFLEIQKTVINFGASWNSGLEKL